MTGEAGFSNINHKGKPVERDTNAPTGILTDNFGIVTLKKPMTSTAYQATQQELDEVVALLGFPNDTTVEIRGDQEVVTQLIAALDKLEITYHERPKLRDS